MGFPDGDIANLIAQAVDYAERAIEGKVTPTQQVLENLCETPEQSARAGEAVVRDMVWLRDELAKAWARGYAACIDDAAESKLAVIRGAPGNAKKGLRGRRKR